MLKEKFEKNEKENFFLFVKEKKEVRVKDKFFEKKEKKQFKDIFNFEEKKIKFVEEIIIFKKTENKKKF